MNLQMESPMKVDGLEFQEVGDEVLVHDPATQKIHVLNRTASELLQRCDGSPVARLVDAMMPHERFDRSRVERDVEKIVGQFVDLGLVKLVASAGRTTQ